MAFGKIKGAATKFMDSAEKDYIIASASAVLSSTVVVPRVDTIINGYTNNRQYTGVVEALIGIGLFIVALHVSHGWAALAVGAGVAFLLQGVASAIFPTVAARAAQSGAPAITTLVNSYIPTSL